MKPGGESAPLPLSLRGQSVSRCTVEVMRDNDHLDVAGKPAHQLPDSNRLEAFDQHRALLFSIAYRMTGSVADAEDMLQEGFMRWQQAFAEDVRSTKSFLVTIISRLCINHLQSARVRREEYVGQWLPEPLVTDPGSDGYALVHADESLSIAFLVLLERLAPVERAVFLLHEVFDYEYSEIAAAVGRTEANCRQILRRARQHVRAARPRLTASPRERDDLLERFLQASRNGHMDGLVALLSEDIVLHSDGGGKAIAVPNLIRGADRVARAVLRSLTKLVPKNLMLRMTQINGEPGFVTYLNGQPFSAITLHADAGRIRAIYVVTNPDKLSHLPPAPA
jgi:RNA polymerase sigma-70 factor (ECF subfamily)